MIRENITNESYFTWRRTPWDEQVFEKKTMEILEIVYEDLCYLKTIFDRINSIIDREGMELIFFRFNSDDNQVKHEALNNEFYIVEHSFILKHSDISKISSDKRRLKFRKPTQDDVESVITIAKDSFLHGRFHEDPKIELDLAKKRYAQWIPQLIKETEFYVLEFKGEVIGFFNYVIKNNNIDLPLSGLSKEFTGLGGFMWKEMFNLINEKEELKKVEVMVSATNLAVINLYNSLNFKITKSMFGYHKHK